MQSSTRSRRRDVPPRLHALLLEGLGLIGYFIGFGLILSLIGERSFFLPPLAHPYDGWLMSLLVMLPLLSLSLTEARYGASWAKYGRGLNVECSAGEPWKLWLRGLRKLLAIAQGMIFYLWCGESIAFWVAISNGDPIAPPYGQMLGLFVLLLGNLKVIVPQWPWPPLADLLCRCRVEALPELAARARPRPKLPPVVYVYLISMLFLPMTRSLSSPDQAIRANRDQLESMLKTYRSHHKQFPADLDRLEQDALRRKYMQSMHNPVKVPWLIWESDKAFPVWAGPGQAVPGAIAYTPRRDAQGRIGSYALKLYGRNGREIPAEAPPEVYLD